MDKSRHSYQIKRGQPLGDRLIWRQPCADRRIARQLAPVIAERGDGQPNSITIGYYRPSDAYVGAWGFVPLSTPLAIAALGIESVRDRICEDLADYITRAPVERAKTASAKNGELGYCPRCERSRAVRIDHGDTLCGACGLVL